MRRSPEARLAGRLFDADKVVKPLLDSDAEEFYVTVQKLWEWNSRYWEQRMRQSNRRVDKSDMDGVAGYRFRAAQAAGVNSASRWMEMSARPGSTAAM